MHVILKIMPLQNNTLSDFYEDLTKNGNHFNYNIKTLQTYKVKNLYEWASTGMKTEIK